MLKDGSECTEENADATSQYIEENRLKLNFRRVKTRRKKRKSLPQPRVDSFLSVFPLYSLKDVLIVSMLEVQVIDYLIISI